MLEIVIYTLVAGIATGAVIGFIIGDILGFCRGVDHVEQSLSCDLSPVTRHRAEEQS